MRRRITAILVLALAASGCSGGVDEAEHQAALDAAARADALVSELRGDLAASTANLDTARSEAASLEDQLGEARSASSAAETRADRAESDLAAARAEIGGIESDLDEALGDRDAALAERDQALFLLGEAVDPALTPISPSATLARVIASGKVRCAVSGALRGFSFTEADGSVSGLDADVCRAIAAAVLGDADDVEFVFATAAERFSVVNSGRADVLVRNTTMTLGRDGSFGVAGFDFGPVVFFDGAKLMGPTSRFGMVPGPGDVDGARLCAGPGEAVDAALAWAGTAGAAMTVVEAGNLIDALQALGEGRCDLVIGEGSALASLRESSIDEGAAVPGDWAIFPATPLTREPLAPGFRPDDPVWSDIVSWVVHATLIAELKGITSGNIDSVEWDPELQRLFGDDPRLVNGLGLDDRALYRVIDQVGNYGEIYDRNLAPLGYTRDGSLNGLYTDGGLLYPPPAR